ncbi:MAG: hypothetical protein NT088_03315 [Candidatus Omnitrophica bacterium]|nr:hypothetical protein [Candidatus Omnitrophota bacterium]
MDKQEALSEFLNGLRIALSSAYAYPREHPQFLKSAQELKLRIEDLLPFLNPLKINIGPDFLIIDKQKLEKLALYAELAQTFHLRKIKSLEFKSGLTVEEVSGFMDAIARPVKDAVSEGSAVSAFKKSLYPHISAQELDYSGFLREEGLESKDIWQDIFSGTLSQEDEKKLNIFAENFDKVITRFSAGDIVNNDRLRESLAHFLAYIKEKNKERYILCAADLLRLILRSREAVDSKGLAQVKLMFEGIDKESLAQILVDEITGNEDFDSGNFASFLELVDEETHKDIAVFLEKKIRESRLANTNPTAAQRFKEILTSSEDSLILPFYRHALRSIVEESPTDSSLEFEQERIDYNYQYILLNLADNVNDADKLELLSVRLAKACETAGARRDIDFLRLALEVIRRRAGESEGIKKIFSGVESVIARGNEIMIFEPDVPRGAAELADSFDSSTLGLSYYMKKIFEERGTAPEILKCLFKFFPEQITYFCKSLKQKQGDIDFLFAIVKSLEAVDSPLAINVLASIFSFSNNLVKTEVLRVLKGIPAKMRGFVLINAVKDLFSVASPLGIRNHILIQNLTLVEELHLREARNLVEDLSRRPYFWNYGLRKRALEALKIL